MVKDADIMKEARKAKAEYMRQWRRRNPGKQAEYSNRYWIRKAMQLNNQDKNANDRKED